MFGFFMRDTFEDEVVRKIRTLTDAQLAALASKLYNAKCEVARPDEGDIVVHDIEKHAELKQYILDGFSML